MKIMRTLLIVTLALTPLIASAQQEVRIDIYGTASGESVRLAYPFPRMGGGATAGVVERWFNQAMLRDLAFARIFTIVPNAAGAGTPLERAARSEAVALLDVSISTEPGSDEFVVEARLVDVASGEMRLGKRFRGREGALTRIAHMVASELMQFYTGNPGVFLTEVAFISDRTGAREVWLMDYDGSNQRRITSLGSITLTPDWSPDAERLAYTSFVRGTSDIYISSRQGGGRVRLNTGVGLNVSPAFSTDGRQIAFVGSQQGNPDIYVMNADGSNVRRLTTSPSVESTPAWSPTGRQIAFTSSRNGSPQIFVMDAEGTNVRRVSFDGEWNDDAVFSPSGDMLAYTSRVSGRFQIRVLELATGATRILAGQGSNEQPSWSADGRHVVFMSNRTGRWQVYRIGADGQDLTQLTFEGSNSSPAWSQKTR